MEASDAIMRISLRPPGGSIIYAETKGLKMEEWSNITQNTERASSKAVL